MSGSDTGEHRQAPAAGGGVVGRVDRLEDQAAAKDEKLEERFDKLTTQLDLAHGAAMEAIALLAGKVVARLDDQLTSAEAAHVARHEQLVAQIEATLQKRHEELSATIDAVQASIMDVVWELGARHPDAEPSEAGAEGGGAPLVDAGASAEDEAVVPAAPAPPRAAGVDEPETPGAAEDARHPHGEPAGLGLPEPEPPAVDAGRPDEEPAAAGLAQPSPEVPAADAGRPLGGRADADLEKPAPEVPAVDAGRSDDEPAAPDAEHDKPSPPAVDGVDVPQPS